LGGLEGGAYNLSNGIHGFLAGFVVCFEPEDEGGCGLAAERLDHWDVSQATDIGGLGKTH